MRPGHVSPYRVRAPTRYFSSAMQRLRNSQALSGARTAGLEAARGPWDAPVARGPTPSAAASHPGRQGAACGPRERGHVALSAPGPPEPSEGALGQGQGHGASLAEAPLGCRRLGPTLAPFHSPPRTRRRWWMERRPMEGNPSACPRGLGACSVSGSGAYPEGPSPRVEESSGSELSGSTMTPRGKRVGAAPALPGGHLCLLGPGEYQPIFWRAKLWLLHSLFLFSEGNKPPRRVWDSWKASLKVLALLGPWTLHHSTLTQSGPWGKQRAIRERGRIPNCDQGPPAKTWQICHSKHRRVTAATSPFGVERVWSVQARPCRPFPAQRSPPRSWPRSPMCLSPWKGGAEAEKLLDPTPRTPAPVPSAQVSYSVCIGRTSTFPHPFSPCNFTFSIDWRGGGRGDLTLYFILSPEKIGIFF